MITSYTYTNLKLHTGTIKYALDVMGAVQKQRIVGILTSAFFDGVGELGVAQVVDFSPNQLPLNTQKVGEMLKHFTQIVKF